MFKILKISKILKIFEIFKILKILKMSDKQTINIVKGLDTNTDYNARFCVLLLPGE